MIKVWGILGPAWSLGWTEFRITLALRTKWPLKVEALYPYTMVKDPQNLFGFVSSFRRFSPEIFDYHKPDGPAAS